MKNQHNCVGMLGNRSQLLAPTLCFIPFPPVQDNVYFRSITKFRHYFTSLHSVARLLLFGPYHLLREVRTNPIHLYTISIPLYDAKSASFTCMYLPKMFTYGFLFTCFCTTILFLILLYIFLLLLYMLGSNQRMTSAMNLLKCPVGC